MKREEERGRARKRYEGAGIKKGSERNREEKRERERKVDKYRGREVKDNMREKVINEEIGREHTRLEQRRR